MFGKPFPEWLRGKLANAFNSLQTELAERGFLFDPPKEREGEGRYIAWMEDDAFD